MMVKKREIFSEDLDCQIFLENRNRMIEDFNTLLVEIKQEKVICKFAAAQIFRMIIEQEEFVKWVSKTAHKCANAKDEKQILKLFVKKAKAVFGDEYDVWYKNYNK